MWNIIGYVDCFDEICGVRGFSEAQKNLLKEIVDAMGLKYKD